MNKPLGRLHDSVQPNGEEMRRDRLSQRFSQEALLERCRAQNAYFSIQSLRRAERGERVARTTVVGIAKALGRPETHYILQEGSVDSTGTPDIIGDWLALSIEDDRLSKAYVLEETTTISQKEDGTYNLTSQSETFARTEFSQNVIVVNDVIIGQTFIENWTPPAGFGSFQFQILRENTFLEGYVTWYDSDTRRIEVSKFVAVRKGIPDFDACVRAARALIETELQAFRERSPR
ncbi:hypothetical protein SAMN05444000_13115 [Shimia gijangensis]|uniref:Uncharacterized protein n=1 Tax=Shimia gijangensis TaxID=1470563 RepID=A0A1M6SPK5_9RHOB|nr:hypothetical protein [Shimia gijangensis]SHK46653.1 hypothetical protein SAMN05444000_13115 [Shimia gijangensis]